MQYIYFFLQFLVESTETSKFEHKDEKNCVWKKDVGFCESFLFCMNNKTQPKE